MGRWGVERARLLLRGGRGFGRRLGWMGRGRGLFWLEMRIIFFHDLFRMGTIRCPGWKWSYLSVRCVLVLPFSLFVYDTMICYTNVKPTTALEYLYKCLVAPCDAEHLCHALIITELSNRVCHIPPISCSLGLAGVIGSVNVEDELVDGGFARRRAPHACMLSVSPPSIFTCRSIALFPNTVPWYLDSSPVLLCFFFRTVAR